MAGATTPLAGPSNEGEAALLRGRLAAEPDLVAIYRRALDATKDEVLAALDELDDAERERAQRFVFPRDWRRHVMSHQTARRALGLACDVAPASIVFGREPLGRPHLVVPAAAPDFNLSHSGELAVIALTRHGRVGVDLETIVVATSEKLAGHVLTPAEQALLAALPSWRRPEQFFRWWTAKEAFLKLNGVGLSVPPDTVQVDDDGVRARCANGSLRHAEAWLTSIDVGANAICTLATERPARVIELQGWIR